MAFQKHLKMMKICFNLNYKKHAIDQPFMLISAGNSSTRLQDIIPEDTQQPMSEDTLDESETSGEMEEISTEKTFPMTNNESDTKKKEVGPAKKSPLRTEKIFRTWASVLKGLGIFYLLWAMVVPVLIDTNAFGIGDLTRKIKKCTQNFFSTNFFSMDHLTCKVEEAIEKYETTVESETEMIPTTPEARNSTTDDTPNTTAKPSEDELETTTEAQTLFNSSIAGDSDTQTSATLKQRANVNNKTKKVTDSEVLLNAIAHEEENEIDVNRQLNKGLNDIWAGIQDNLHRRFVSSIHHNIVTLLRRTIFPKQQKSLEEGQLRNDAVDIVLDLLIEEFDGSHCRERLVCDARRLVSTLPYISGWFGTPSENRSTSSNNGVYKYAEAATRGAVGGDCNTYTCPYNSVQLVTGWL